MFRFTIRELLMLTVVAALGIGWGQERWRSTRLEKNLRIAESESQLMRMAVVSLHEDMERIEKGLPAHGLKLEWTSDMRPSVAKRKPAGP